MNNGRNSWGVEYHRIVWFENLLNGHPNVINIHRHDDIVFKIDRRRNGDHLKVLCCYEYTMGITAIHRALYEFGELNIIHVGGGWCGYTLEAKQLCLDSQIGLYVSNEMNGALWRDDYWNYYQKDRDGNPVSFSRSA
jgi:hypothetical protein